MSVRKLEYYYNNTYSTKQLKADLNRKDRLKLLFNKEIRNKKILDIGCGPGVDIHFLLENKDNEVHGIDISDDALQYAKKEGIITHKIDLLQIEQLPFKEKYFDIIIATDILEHLFFPKDLLLEIYRVMKDDGFAIISVPNHFYLKGRLKILCGGGIIHPAHKDINEWDYFHIRFFTLQSFEKLIKQTKFTIEERFYDKFINCPRGLPHFIDKYFARKFPNLFSMHFMVKVTRRDKL